MNYASKQNKQNNRGFTLAEMLIGVAILVVLMSIAIPGAVAFQRKLHMAELDDYARQIFMAAQSEMTNMKASGRLDVYKETIDDNKHELTQRPKDYPGVESDKSWENLFWVSSDEATTQKYLMKTNTSLTEATAKGGHFLLLLNPLSGDVYGAFYSEEEITIDTVMALNNWTRETRSKAEPKIGYYGSTNGGQIEYGTVGLPKTFNPKLEVVNGEELYVKISCSGMRALRWTQNKLKLTLTVTDAHDKSMQLTYTGGSKDLFIINDSITVTKILDSLESKNSFEKVCKGLTPGDDLTIKVELNYSDDKNNKLITGSAEEKVNSLFGSVEKDSDGKITEINVFKVRHLNNLRKTIFKGANVKTGTHVKTGTQVVQTESISFDWVDWESNDYVSDWTKNPMENFPAIDCGNLLSGGGYNGGGNVLKGFLFTGTNSGLSGLFDSLERATLTEMRFADCSSKGTNAGILAGSLINCTVTDCGAYLNTKNKDNARYEDMDTRRKTYSVKGTNSAGGLAAQITDSSLNYCFAAVDVSGDRNLGGSNLGGLAGITNGATIENSYASGNLSGDGQNMGGLIGSMTDGSVSKCYATGKVYCTGSVAGGLIGAGTGGSVSNSVSYGIVAKSEEDTVAKSSGGFIGQNNGISFSGCKFLKQANYNSSYTKENGVTESSYNSLRVSSTVDNSSNSVPYSTALRGQAFPFKLIANEAGGKMPHYGDWPEPYKLENSLVYYERYSDGTYGYYAKTSLIDSDGKANGNWVLDTLQDKVCVEDGYALLTVYKLGSFDYTLHTGDKNVSDKTVTGVKIAKDLNSATADEAALLLENVSLQFKDYSVNENGVGYAETTISNAKMYRLPFNLQVTTRTAAYTFWETLTITGYSASTKAKVIDKAVFYYCPDFAKNAVNPVGGSTTKPTEPGSGKQPEDTPIYVRSARQLNALSRSIYYWNQNVDNGGKKLYFKQETDIDFGTYARYWNEDGTSTTSYCGQTFDLMDTSEKNIYRNVPIGTPNKTNDPTRASNFQNIYDGQGHKIIDYCQLNTKYQFAGLFGEVEYAILKNIVMTASVPDNGNGQYSAYIKSSFNNSSYKGGVGALAGLLYERPVTDGLDTKKDRAQIVNCSVSGYHVEYIGGDSMNYAAGGLVGFNFGSVSNSSAVCNVYGSNNSSTDGRIGGLVGSLNGRATVSNSYSGGTIYASQKAQVGGISGGIYNIYGYNYDQWAGYRTVKVSNCYSYCTLNNSNLAGANSVYPVAVESGEYKLTVNNCYYLTDTMTYVNTQYMNGVSGRSYAELCNLTFTDSGKAVAEHTYPYSESLKDQAYSFPAFVKNADTFVHYGDWPLKTP